MILDGWFDWAERMPGNPTHVNGGVNDKRGIFLHSAEGYAEGLLNLAVHGPLSWHLSNLMDGRLVQHFPLTAQCWHASAANNHYIGMENEGVFTREHSLNEAQIANAVRVIEELSEWMGWVPSRTGDMSQTLWEHREVVWLGGSATACPSGRIPWDVILSRLSPGAETIDGLGLKASDGADLDLWPHVAQWLGEQPGRTIAGIGLHYTHGEIERIWP